MSVYEKAIKEGKYNIQHSDIANKTFEDFSAEVKGKKVYFYGAGNGFFWAYVYVRYVLGVDNIYGVIDSSEKLNQASVEEQLGVTLAGDAGESKIVNLYQLAMQENKDDIVIIISLVNKIDEVINCLEDAGFGRIYSFLTMFEKQTRNSETKNAIQFYEEKCHQNSVGENVLFYMSIHAGNNVAIFQALKKKYPKTQITCIVEKMPDDKMEDVEYILVSHQLQVIKAFATAAVVLIDLVSLPYQYKKREGQIYIQTKHWGSVTFKKFGVADNQDDCNYVHYFNELYDYIIVGSEFDKRSCKEGFEFDGPFIDIGTPRSDILFDATLEKKIFRKIGLSSEYKYILYAPTFRATVEEDVAKISVGSVLTYNFDRICEVFEERFGGEFKLLLRLHPLVADKAKDFSFSDRVIDVSGYKESQELVAISYAMISDYSSIMFEHAYVKKPVFLLADDVQEYVNNQKDVLIDYEDLPFAIAETEDELIDNVRNFDEEAYTNRVTQFLDEKGVHEDGHASEKAADFIVSLLKK